MARERSSSRSSAGEGRKRRGRSQPVSASREPLPVIESFRLYSSDSDTPTLAHFNKRLVDDEFRRHPFQASTSNYEIKKCGEDKEIVDASFSTTTYLCDERVKLELARMKKAFAVFIVAFLGAILTYHYTATHGPRPRPFFFTDNTSAGASGVADMWRGNNASPSVLRSKSDVAIAFYYAAWNRDARLARRPFLRIAHAYKNHPEQVSFTAINCWTGECRRSFQMFTFPVIVAYTRSLSILYQGRMETGSLFRWVRRLLNPARVIRSSEEMLDFTLSSHYSVLGYFPFSKHARESPGYGAFMAAAVLTTRGFLSDDNLGFGVILNETVAASAGLFVKGALRFQSISEPGIIIPPGLTAEKLVERIQTERKSPASLRYVGFNKNIEVHTEQFSDLLNKSAIMMLITNVDLFYKGQDDITLFKESALDYWACNPRLIGAAKERLVEINQQRHERLLHDSKKCERASVKFHKLSGCCESLAETSDLQALCVRGETEKLLKWECENFAFPHGGGNTCQRHEETLVTPRNSVTIRNHHCFELSQHFNAGGIVDDCCGLGYGKPARRRSESLVLRRRMSQLKKLDDSCRQYSLAQKSPQPPKVSYEENQGDPLPAYGCARNNSMEWVVGDYRDWRPMLRKWGTIKKPLPQVFAIDTARELFVLMEAPLTRENLYSFVAEYHRDAVTDTLLSEEDVKSEFIYQDLPRHCEGELELIPITTRTLETLTAERKEDTPDFVVLFTGGRHHAPSASISHVLLSAANYFCDYENLIQFYVLDTSRNEAPFTYHIDRVPALIFFSGKNTETSWRYPPELPLRVPNIVAWITSRGSRTLRWAVALSACNIPCLRKNRRSLLHQERKLRLEAMRLLSAAVGSDNIKLRTLHKKRLGVARNTVRLRHAVESLLGAPSNFPHTSSPTVTLTF